MQAQFFINEVPTKLQKDDIVSFSSDGKLSIQRGHIPVTVKYETEELPKVKNWASVKTMLGWLTARLSAYLGGVSLKKRHDRPDAIDFMVA